MSEKITNLPLRSTMCATCPFRAGSKYACLVADLAQSACGKASRICHSTGSNAINAKTGKPEALCRGARNIQLQLMATLGVIAAPTDKAWNDARYAIGLPETELTA